ncbi:MAG: hypothetical protein ACREB3_06530, partial [Burkholderiales bacterium]
GRSLGGDMSHWLIFAAIILVTTVAAWITALQLRRRMSRALGRNVGDAELTSINTWMKVHEAEGQPPANRPSADNQDSKRWSEPN